jgi:hypothetical protein
MPAYAGTRGLIVMGFLLVIGLSVVLSLVLCVVFVRNHLFSAVVCSGMYGLWYYGMTVMLFEGAERLLIALAVLFAVLFIIEKVVKPLKSRAIVNMDWVLGIVRFPANFVYAGDIIFRLLHWGPVSDVARDQPSLRAVVGSMLELPLVVSAAMGVVLLVLYAVQIVKGVKRGRSGAEAS